MEGRRSRRRLAIGLVIAAIAAGVALAIVLGGDDEGDKRAASAPTAATDTETVTTEETVSERTDTVTGETSETQKQDQQEVQESVTTFVESSEQGDSQRACSQVAGGAGKELEDCAAAAGIDLRELPSSDELQIDDVDVSGDRAKAKLSNGSSFSLTRSGGRWKITGFQPQRRAGSHRGLAHAAFR